MRHLTIVLLIAIFLNLVGSQARAEVMPGDALKLGSVDANKPLTRDDVVVKMRLSENERCAQNGGEDVAPAHCGVLGFWNGGKKIFLHSCLGADVVVKLCSEGSSFEIGDGKYCIGPERRIPKTEYRSFIDKQLEPYGPRKNFGVITRGDILARLGYCEPGSDEYRSGYPGSREDCIKNGPTATAKINNEIDEALKKVCSKDGVHVPKEGEFLHTVLSQYKPSSHPCSSEKECAEEVEVDHEIVGAVMYRTVNGNKVEEYIKDKISTYTWSPRSPDVMHHSEAIAYCEKKNDLGLKWTLPPKEAFSTAFVRRHNHNRDSYRNNSFCGALSADSHWTSSIVKDTQEIYAYRFSGCQRDTALREYTKMFVRCVGGR